MAEHRARGWGRPWSGTPADVVRLAQEGQKIVRSASHGQHEASVLVRFPKGREANYDSPEEFLAGISALDIPQVTSLMILWMDHSSGFAPPGSLVVTVDLVRGLRMRPFVTATADDPSIVDGVARRVAAMFTGRGWWQGLRRHEQSRWQRVLARTGGLVPLIVTAAVTAIASVLGTIYGTRLLSGH